VNLVSKRNALDFCPASLSFIVSKVCANLECVFFISDFSWLLIKPEIFEIESQFCDSKIRRTPFRNESRGPAGELCY
jgi:hypothetical protein